jgi:exosortase/archaeosortase family protein
MRPLPIALFILVLPVLETAAIRWAGHRAFGPNVSALGFHFTDIYWPLLLGAFFSICHLKQRKRLPFRFQGLFLMTNIVLFTVTVTGLLFSDYVWMAVGSSGSALLFFSGGLATLMTAPLAFLDTRSLLGWAQSNLVRLGLIFMAVVTLASFPYVLQVLWPWMIVPLGESLRFCFQALGFSITRFDIENVIGIHHPLLRVSVGMPCSGLLGIFFFLFAYFLYLGFTDRRAPLRRRVIDGCLGVTLMFLINVFRIVLFFSVAIWINKLSSLQYGKRFFVWAFHENIGWLLYLVGLYWFFRYLGRSDRGPQSSEVVS